MCYMFVLRSPRLFRPHIFSALPHFFGLLNRFSVLPTNCTLWIKYAGRLCNANGHGTHLGRSGIGNG